MAFWAALVLVVHVAYILFVVAGLALIWIGAWLGWRWVRNFWFRVLHLCAIALVALEAILGIACPLTVLEDQLRTGSSTDIGFLERLAARRLVLGFPDLGIWRNLSGVCRRRARHLFRDPALASEKRRPQMKTGRS